LAPPARYTKVKLTAEERVGLATLFMDEVLLHHDCLVKIGESMGVQTLADLCFLQGAIMRGTFIEHYRDSSSIVDLINSLPSAIAWHSYIDII
jgi:hypothetical protein